MSENFQTAVNERLKTGAFCGHPEIHLHAEADHASARYWLWLEKARVDIPLEMILARKPEDIVEGAIRDHKDDQPHLFDRFKIDAQVRCALQDITLKLPDEVAGAIHRSYGRQLDESETFRERHATRGAFSLEPHEQRELMCITAAAIITEVTKLHDRALAAEARVKELEDLDEAAAPDKLSDIDTEEAFGVLEKAMKGATPAVAMEILHRMLDAGHSEAVRLYVKKSRSIPPRGQKAEIHVLDEVKDFPHACPCCGSPAYVGLGRVECSRPGCGGR